MLANAYIPIYGIIVGLAVAIMTVVPSLVVEAIAVRFGEFRESVRPSERGRARINPPFSWAVYYAFVANCVSTLVGLVTAYLFVSSKSVWIWLLHYAITLAIEIPIYHLLGLKLRASFVAILVVANTLTYGLMYALILLVD